MHSACPGCTLLGPASATYRTDQHCCPELPFRSNQAASFQRTAVQGNRRRPPAVLSRCFLIDRIQASAGAKHRAAQTRLNAFHYDYLNPPELSNKPLDVFKRRLYSIFPILANEELVSRAAWTLMVIAIARLGQQLRLPYVDANITPEDGAGYTVEAMMGGATRNPYNVFLLGIGPMINASLITAVFTNLGEKGAWGTRLQEVTEGWKTSGVEGQGRMLGMMNQAALVIAIFQASFRSVTLQHCAKPAPGVPFLTLTTVLLVAGAAILRWLAQSIESQGLGDGTSLLITLSIVTNYAKAVGRVSKGFQLGMVSASSLVSIGVGYMVLVVLAVLTNSLALHLPLIYYKQRRSKATQQQAALKKKQAIAAAVGSKGPAPSTAYLPLRLTTNGMSAVLYASFIYSVPDVIGLFSTQGRMWASLFLTNGTWFPLIYGITIFGCGLIQLGDSSPKNMSNYLNAVEAGVQGVSPGPSTEKYLTSKMKAVRLWGALSVAVLAVIAQYFDMYCLVKIGTSISSLSLLLVVGLITSCIRQVQSLLQLPRLEKALERERNVLQRMTSVQMPST
ncbi:hypothetical protein ABBQ38_014249 [Trebouxia sp. C0009 RCD-2024]